MKKLKATLFSENGMNVVNILFCLAIFLRGHMVQSLVFLVWLLYLVYSIKHTERKVLKVVYLCFAVGALCVIALNLYSLAVSF